MTAYSERPPVSSLWGDAMAVAHGELRHIPTDDCSGVPVMYASQCVECGVRLCSCELTYGHDCEVS